MRPSESLRSIVEVSEIFVDAAKLVMHDLVEYVGGKMDAVMDVFPED